MGTNIEMCEEAKRFWFSLQYNINPHCFGVDTRYLGQQDFGAQAQLVYQ
jgi:hypothetical protein